MKVLPANLRKTTFSIIDLLYCSYSDILCIFFGVKLWIGLRNGLQIMFMFLCGWLPPAGKVRFSEYMSGYSKRTSVSKINHENSNVHFPDEMAEIEAFHDEEYQKQREVIQEQINKIQSENEELKNVA